MSVRHRSTLGAPRTLGDHVNLRSNGLNLCRLVLASSVIIWHSFTITGHPLANRHFGQLLGDGPVDGFFAISGFLLCASWFAKPKLLSFARNRMLRLVPAYWTSLVVVALVAAPVSLAIKSDRVGEAFHGPHSAAHYILDNLLLRVHFFDVSGTPLHVPYPGVWNGSAWTLIWEAYAYIGLAVVAASGLLRWRLVIVAFALLAWAGMIAEDYDLVRHNFYLDRGSRLGLMFLCGMLIYLYRDKLPSRRWAPTVMFIVLIASVALRDYRVVGAPAIAYLVVWVGGSIRNRRLQLTRVDISYGMYIYAFPVQQLLAIAGLVSLPALGFAAVSTAATVPVAAASWFAIERPALKLKSIRRRGPAPVVAPGAPVQEPASDRGVTNGAPSRNEKAHS